MPLIPSGPSSPRSWRTTDQLSPRQAALFCAAVLVPAIALIGILVILNPPMDEHIAVTAVEKGGYTSPIVLKHFESRVYRLHCDEKDAASFLVEAFDATGQKRQVTVCCTDRITCAVKP